MSKKNLRPLTSTLSKNSVNESVKNLNTLKCCNWKSIWFSPIVCQKCKRIYWATWWPSVNHVLITWNYWVNTISKKHIIMQ